MSTEGAFNWPRNAISVELSVRNTVLKTTPVRAKENFPPINHLGFIDKDGLVFQNIANLCDFAVGTRRYFENVCALIF